MNNSTLIYSHDDVTIHQIADADSRRLDGFKALFEAQMPEYAFYFNRIVASIQHPYDSTTGQRHHVWLVAIADEPAGLAVTEYLPGRDLGLGMDFAIYPHFRSRHVEGLSLAAWIVRERLRQLARDGAAAGRTSIVPLAVEVGPRALLQRFQTYGLTPLPIFYHEPPDVSGKTNPRGLGDAESLLAVGYNPMQLGVYAPIDAPDFDPHDHSLWARILRAFLIDHYHLTEDNRALLLALASFSAASPTSISPPST